MLTLAIRNGLSSLSQLLFASSEYFDALQNKNKPNVMNK